MEATLIASSSSLFSLRSKVLFSNGCMNRADLRCKLSSGSNKRLHFRTSAIKIQDAGHFGEPKNLTSYVGELAEKLCEPLLKPLKGFPWEDAKDRVLERLLTLGENALKWGCTGRFPERITASIFPEKCPGYKFGKASSWNWIIFCAS
ncbi:uncharacterized protein [Typha angustifolia]|uniref:uncharacterized protein isoform X2 n=1 Tax=Typha angustifolia TaxID=59011 RepID=UPI003C2E5B8A